VKVHWYNEILRISRFLDSAIFGCKYAATAATAYPAHLELWASMFQLREDTGGYGRIWEDMRGYERIWEDTGGYGRIREDTGGYGPPGHPKL